MNDSGAKLTGAQKEELMDTVKQQIAVANAQELLKVYNRLIHLFNVKSDEREVLYFNQSIKCFGFEFLAAIQTNLIF